MKKNIVPFTDTEERVIKKMIDQRTKASEKFPLGFALIATFGIAAFLYGFEKLIDQIDAFANNPWVPLITGFVILVITGTVYQKLN